jgi:hypothetical protein
MQIDWKHFPQMDMWRSTGPAIVRGRFYIARTASGFTVGDAQEGTLERTTTLPCAMAWAGIQVGETVVRHHKGESNG